MSIYNCPDLHEYETNRPRFFFAHHYRIRSPHFEIQTSFKMPNKSHATRVKELGKTRTKRESEKRRLKRQAAARARTMQMYSENLETYRAMNLDQKYEFAFRGYVFEKYPKHKAIYMDFTNMTTQAGYDRCVRAGTAFEKLPEGFIVLFSKLEVSNVKSKGDAARYQVELTKTSFLQPHTDPCTSYGLAQFINCCLPENSTIDWIEGQNMKVKQCELITNIDHRLRPDYKNLSPAYVKVIAKVKQHHELLLPSRYGGRHRISA
jgi:hypothetical protein